MSETVISWASDGGIATKNAPLIVQPGSMLLVDNLRQERKNEWRTRSGNGHNAADDLPGANVPVMCTGAPWGGFLGLTRETAYAKGGAGRIYSATAGTRWVSPGNNLSDPGADPCSQLTPANWSRSPVAPMITGSTGASQVSTAQGGNYRVTAWWSASAGGNTGVQVSIQSLDGSTSYYSPQFGSDAAACRPRCVYSSAANQLVIIYVDGAHDIVAWTIDATTGAFVHVGVLLAADGYAVGVQQTYLDAIYYGGPTVTIVYRNNVGAGNVGFIEYNPAANTFALTSTLISCSTALSLFADPDASGVRMLGVGSSVPAVRVFRLDNTGATLTNHLVQAGIDCGAITGVAYNAGVDWMCVYGGSAYGINLSACKRRAGVTSAVKLLCPAGVFGHGIFMSLTTTAWREPGTDAMRYILGVAESAAFNPQPTYLEMALEFENANAQIFNNWTEPQARLVPLNADVVSTARGALSNVTRIGTDRFAVSLARVALLTDPGDGAIGPQFTIDVWSVQYLNATTYTNQNVGEGAQTPQDAFLPSGSLIQTATGQIVCAHGASALPFTIDTLTPSNSTGVLDPAKTYAYGITVSMPDELGNEWRSPMSIIKKIVPGGAWVAPNNTITVAGALTPFENQLRRRIVMIWRTDGNGATFKLLHVIDDTVANTTSYSFADATTNVGTGQEYTFQIPGTSTTGELEATITGGLIHPTLWGGRLFGIDRDFPSRVRWSKPISAGLLPEFPEEFADEIEDAFGGATGLAALDDKIVLFKQNAIYVAGGAGPNNDGSGATFSFQLISQESGSLIGSPLLSTGSEVYMICLGGAFRLKRSQEVDFVGAAIDKYLSMPLLASPETVTGMVLSPPKNEVRIQTTNYRFVHDRIFDIWERDTGGMTGSGIVMTRMLGTRQAFFLSNGQMWIEAADSNTPADAGVSYAGSLRSPWMRPAKMEGWISLLHLRAVGECTLAGVVAQPTLAIYFDNSDTLVERFQPRVQIAATAGAIRADAKPRRRLCTAFSPQLTLPAGDATIRFDSWAALVDVEPGMQGIGAEKNWAPSP